MISREKEIVDAVVEIVKNKLDPDRIFLFGSRAKGSNGQSADFDIAIEAKKPSISTQREINEKIDEISGLYKVDVVYMDSIDDEFKNIILESGEIIYEQRA